MNNVNAYPLISIITVTYNTDDVTAALLQSLKQVTYRNFEIIVVDNASARDAGYLGKDYPEICFIQNTVNEGFAGGNNRGIEQAKGEIIFLINNDTEVEPSFLEPIVELFNANEQIGIISPKIRYYHTKDVIQYAGGTKINAFTARGRFIGSSERDTGQYDQPQQTLLAHGAAMAIRKKVLDTIGLLPEAYFLYYEELDFCEHAKSAGFEIWYQPKSLIYHKESMSVGKESATKVYFQNRNRLLFIRRNVKGLKKVVSIAFFTAIAMPVSLTRYALQRKWKFAGLLIKGLIWNIKHQNTKN
jgi:GT2 family glycosyltransferase